MEQLSGFYLNVLDNKHEVIINREIFMEYDDVLHRERFGFDEEVISYILDWFRDNAIWIEVTKSQIPMPDEKDRVFYDAAKCTESKLVTGNNRHYPVDELVTSLWEFE